MKHRKHYDELTVMSGIAIMFVLAIHGCGGILQSFHPDSGTYAASGLWLRTLSNFAVPAVPMFLFIAGFKYAANDKCTPYFTFLKKRLPRVLMPFAIINTVFWGLDCIKYMESFDIVLLTKTYLHSWVGYSVAYQLWYIPMYCCVIIACPLVRNFIPCTKVRFWLYAVLGILQRILEIDYPILASYPIRFLSYPVFFEMGVWAQERAWNEKITNVAGVGMASAYFLMVMLFSQILPKLSANELVKYIFYYFAGTASMFTLSVALKSNRILHWLGAISYPIFLLHEPLIGGYMDLLLNRLNINHEVIWLFAWIVFVLLVSVILMQLLVKSRLDRLLWKFKI